MNKQGYGRFRISLGHQRRKRVQAHRFAWEAVNGPIPIGKIVRHSCDNPCCCNPAHLLVGTHAENSADMVSRDRQAKGEANGGGGKLTRNEAAAILFLCRHSSFTKAQIAKQFGVTDVLVSYIDNGKAWKDLRRPPLYIEGLGTW